MKLQSEPNLFIAFRIKNSICGKRRNSIKTASFLEYNFISGNSLSVTAIDWTDDEKYLQFTGENKQVFIAKMPCKY